MIAYELRKKENGDCVYCGKKDCIVWDIPPIDDETVTEWMCSDCTMSALAESWEIRGVDGQVKYVGIYGSYIL